MIKPPKKKTSRRAVEHGEAPRDGRRRVPPLAFPVPRAPRRKFLATSDPAASAPRVAGDGGGFIADRASRAGDRAVTHRAVTHQAGRRRETPRVAS